MSNDIEVYPRGKFNFPWNPFQDLLDCRIEQELIHGNGPTQPIIIPRCGPFFSKDFKIKLKSSSRELKFEEGDYSFVYPFQAFINGYNRLVFGGVLLHKDIVAQDYYIDYDTIGGEFVLDDIMYASLVANVVNNPRTADWSQLINVPSEFPPDPHDHPASDTVDYNEMIIWLKSYLDAMTGMDTSLTVAKILTEHLKDNIQKAHGGTLADLGIKYLKDYPICDENSIKGESNQVLATVWGVKRIVRAFLSGEMQ